MPPLSHVQSDTETLGTALRQWRTATGLSLSQVALRAGIAKSSISVWENNLHQPRIPELTAVLASLGVGPRETHLALSHIRAPRATKGQAALVQISVEGAEMAPTPGRLLRTIRERRGVSLRRLARSVGRTPMELVRWETKGVQPSAAMLTTLLAHLEPRESEARWLKERFSRLAPPGSCEGATLDLLAERLKAVGNSIREPDHVAVDLEFLIWEMQVYGWLAARREEAMELLQEGRSDYAVWLTWEGRLAEGNQYAASAMRLGELASVRFPSPAFTAAAHVRASYEARSPRRMQPRSAVRLLHSWLGASDNPKHQSPILRDIAQFALEAKEMEYALKASEKALQLAYATDNIRFIQAARYARIEIVTRGGLWSEAFTLLTEESERKAESAYARIQQSFRWVDFLTAVGDGAGADDALRQVYADIERYEYLAPSLIQRADNAALNIEILKYSAV